MHALIPQAKGFRHCEVPIRQHDGVESMLSTTGLDALRSLRTDRHDLDTALIELGPEFFPSP